MKRAPYSHFQAPRRRAEGGPVALSGKELPNCGGVLEHARAVLRLAEYLGGDTAEALASPAPLLSRLCGRRMFYLRGWSRYESCVKGFNALGLLAEYAGREERALARLSAGALRRAKLEYLASRESSAAALRALPGRKWTPWTPGFGLVAGLFPTDDFLRDLGQSGFACTKLCGTCAPRPFGSRAKNFPY